MRNIDVLRRMRRAGFQPHHVNVATDAGALKFDWRWPGVSDEAVLVQIEPHEALQRLDLRCFQGLLIAVSGCVPQRVEAVADACVKAGASRVIATTSERRGEGEFMTFNAVRVTDTAGVLQWPN